MSVANDKYEPSSEFLRRMIKRTDALSDNSEDRRALARLIKMTRDHDVANRDWATMLLRQQGLDTPEVRDALLFAAKDENESVRAEAIRGLADMDRSLALPLVREALKSDNVSAPILEAAAIVADASLIHDLRAFAEPSDDDYLDRLTLEAIAACEAERSRARP